MEDGKINGDWLEAVKLIARKHEASEELLNIYESMDDISNIVLIKTEDDGVVTSKFMYVKKEESTDES